jgi:hypothetical protein
MICSRNLFVTARGIQNIKMQRMHVGTLSFQYTVYIFNFFLIVCSSSTFEMYIRSFQNLCGVLIMCNMLVRLRKNSCVSSLIHCIKL